VSDVHGTAAPPAQRDSPVPSKTALATSVISARVGRGLDTMLSSIWVAVICLVARAVADVYQCNSWPHGTARHGIQP
jgi:hypothetical protein